jgi:uridine kinase
MCFRIPGLTFNNWEVPEAIDFDAFVQGLDNARDNAAGLVAKCGGNAVVIVEGFLLLQDERITRQLTRTFFLAISRQLSMERRYALRDMSH